MDLHKMLNTNRFIPIRHHKYLKLNQTNLLYIIVNNIDFVGYFSYVGSKTKSAMIYTSYSNYKRELLKRKSRSVSRIKGHS